MQLARHPHGAPVLDALYVKLPSSKRSAVLSEFYGREFQLLMLQERSSGACIGVVAWSSQNALHIAQRRDANACTRPSLRIASTVDCAP